MVTEKKVPVEPGKEVVVEGVDKPKPVAAKPEVKHVDERVKVGTAVDGALVVPVVVHVENAADLTPEEQAKKRAPTVRPEDKEEVPVKKEDKEGDSEK